MNRTLRALAFAPLLLSSIHALTEPEKHAGPLTDLADRVLGHLVANEDRRTELGALTGRHALLLARLSGAALGATTLYSIWGRNAKPAAVTLLASLPVLGLANHPHPIRLPEVETTQPQADPKRLDPTQPLSTVEKHRSGWMLLAPIAAALIMVLREKNTDTKLTAD